MTNTALVLEKSDIQRDIICRMIAAAGWTPMPCKSRQEAFSALAQMSFGALFLDAHIDRGDSLLHVDRFRERAPGPPIVIMMASKGQDSPKAIEYKAQQSGVHIISKPFDDAKLKRLFADITSADVARQPEAPACNSVDPEHVSLTVDQPNCLVTLRFLKNVKPEAFRTAVLDAFKGVNNAYLYDWLIDLCALSPAALSIDGEELRVTWLNMTMGRDVGRRMALIISDPAVEAFIRTAIRGWVVREFAIFQNHDEGRAWLMALSSTSRPGSEQFI